MSNENLGHDWDNFIESDNFFHENVICQHNWILKHHEKKKEKNFSTIITIQDLTLCYFQSSWLDVGLKSLDQIDLISGISSCEGYEIDFPEMIHKALIVKNVKIITSKLLKLWQQMTMMTFLYWEYLLGLTFEDKWNKYLNGV